MYSWLLTSFTLFRSRRGALYGSLLLSLLLLCGLSGCGAQRAQPGPHGKAPSAASKIMESAYSQLGARYRLGGDSPGKGFDCSGFVHWAYQQQGIAVPRITTDQARTGRLVAPQEGLQVADILVFKNRQGPRGLHTGLYAGGGKFIHSPRQGERVRTESLEATYWKNTLIGARRLVQ